MDFLRRLSPQSFVSFDKTTGTHELQIQFTGEIDALLSVHQELTCVIAEALRGSLDVSVTIAESQEGNWGKKFLAVRSKLRHC